MTTIVDVARAAGVSTATVSRVLNNQPQVDPRLAATVLLAVKDLGYRPNRVARSLRTRRNRVWALILSGVRTGPFFADVVRGVEEVAYGAGYVLFLCNADEDPSKEASYIDLAVAENVGGVILMPSGPSTALTPLVSSGIPLVLIDRVLPGHEADAVIADNSQVPTRRSGTYWLEVTSTSRASQGRSPLPPVRSAMPATARRSKRRAWPSITPWSACRTSRKKAVGLP